MLRTRLPFVAPGFVAAGLFAFAGLGCGHDAPEDVSTSEAPLNANPKLGDFVIEAGNSVRLQGGGLAVRGGDVGARGKKGPYLSGGATIDVNTGSWVQSTHNLIGDSIRLDWGTTVGGLQTNHLYGSHGWHGRVGGMVALPDLPAAAAAAPGGANVTVGAGATSSASPGAFGTISVGNGGKLRLAAGAYDVGDVNLGSGARLEALGAVQLRVANRVSAKSGAFIGGAPGAGLSAKAIRIDVSGKNGGDGGMNASPKAAAFANADIRALVLVPNGTLVLGDGTRATGAFMARDVDIGGSGARVVFQDGFTASGGGPTCTAASCDDGNPCTTDACGAGGACTHTNVAAGTSCSDGNACNGAETCNGAGTCQMGTPVVCGAPDPCHNPGTCNPATGVCTNPPKADGSACNDGNACTQTDNCQAGVCVGANQVTCAATDQCHTAGTCNPSSGVCSNPVKTEGSACNDGNACTQTDSCQAGVCVGANQVVCGAADVCHLAGMCNPSTGTCGYLPKADGSACSDGDSCTTGDSCQAGLCMPGSPSCDALAITETLTGGSTSVKIANTLSLDVGRAVPGDAITFTSDVTNLGTTLDVAGEFRVTNKGSTTFTVRGYQQTLEYFSIQQNSWVTFAKLGFDNAGNPVSDPSVFALEWWNLISQNGGSPGVVYSSQPVVGTTIAAGATALWGFRIIPLLPGDVAAVVFDPSKASQIRSAIRFDTTSGPMPAPGTANLASITAGATGAVANPAVALQFGGGMGGGALVPATPGPIAAGATKAFTGVMPAPVMAPHGAAESDTDYLNRLYSSIFFGYFMIATATGDGIGAAASASLTIPADIPVVPLMSGEPTVNGDGTSTYQIPLTNSGRAMAGPFAFTDSVNGAPVPFIANAPGQLDWGTSASASVTIATPAGPYTNVLTMTWQDRNGNLYGPLTYVEGP